MRGFLLLILAALALSCREVKRSIEETESAASLMDIPVPWDTLQLHATLGEPEWRRLFFTPTEHCTAFKRMVSYDIWGTTPIGDHCGLEYEPVCYKEYTPSLMQTIAPSLFFERTIDIPYLKCLVAFEYPRYVTGVLLSMPSYHVLSPPKISMKLFHHDTLIERLSQDTTPMGPFDKDGFRRLYKELDRYLQALTGDRSPYQSMPYLKQEGCLPPRGYVDLIGSLSYGLATEGCIEARLSCLPIQPVRNYHREALKSVALIWDPDKDAYWEDTSVQDEQQFQAKYHRHSTTSDRAVYDVRWEDLAIYVEILVNRHEGQIHGVGDTTGMEPCPRIASTRLPRYTAEPRITDPALEDRSNTIHTQ